MILQNRHFYRTLSFRESGCTKQEIWDGFGPTEPGSALGEDAQLKLNGHRMEPEEIEAQIRSQVLQKRR
ncbi:MAG: hypothetical protein ACLRMZ_21880 [Blautia marasmi]